MKIFTKSLLAVAMLAAGTGAANASIQVGNNTASEVYLSVYDTVKASTFNLDLGVTMGTLVANLNNTAFSLSFDLAALTSGSAGAKWTAFNTGLNSLTTVYGLVVTGQLGKLMATGPDASPAKFASVNAGNASITSLVGHTNIVNTAALADNGNPASDPTSLNLSSIVLDSDTPETGQHNLPNQFSDLSGTKSDAGADIAYGTAGKFYYYNGGTSVAAAAQVWNLSGSTLTYKVSAVPLPAAVWMFGAGLMGVLRLNRRKSMAA